MCPFSINLLKGLLLKKVKSKALICDPSTSASVIIIIFPYLKSFKSISSSFGSKPSALIKVTISLDEINFAKVFVLISFPFPLIFFFVPLGLVYVFKIFPLNGRTAWYSLFLPCFADPPAESPSTINNSVPSCFEFWQSANFPGNPLNSKAPFLLTFSLAFLATSLANAACTTLAKIIFATEGFWSNQTDNFSFIKVSTIFLTSEETNLSFVWDENFGSGIFTDKTHVKPSFMSSPEIETLFFFSKFCSVAYLFITLVNELLNPNKWVPPSFWYILLVYG